MRMGNDRQVGWQGIGRRGARWVLAAAFAGGFAGAALGQGQLPCRYEVAHIITAPPCGIFGPPTITGYGISPNGRYVCGSYSQCDEWGEGYIFDTTTGILTTIPRPPGVVNLSAGDVNDSGMAIGQLERLGVGARGFVYSLQTGSMIELQPLPGGLWSDALAINNANQVCGYRSLGAGGEPQTAFRWSAKEGFTDLGLLEGVTTIAYDINDLGECTIGLGPHGTISSGLWTGSEFHPTSRAPGVDWSIERRINNSGWTAGVGGDDPTDPAWTSNPIVWIKGIPETISLIPPYDRAGSADLNDAGIVVGRLTNSAVANDARAYVWRSGETRDLNELVVYAGDLFIRECEAISSGGHILVRAQVNGDWRAVVLQPVEAKLGDLNCDGHVNVSDLLALISQWGPCFECPGDFTQDSRVNVSDLLILILNWG